MARVVVVGGGLGGVATALRLAKRGHDVDLVERAAGVGGALGEVAWTALPAVLRDLFRKTGRPLEREVDLVPLAVLREHRFVDGTRVLLPGGSRLAQHRAMEALGPGLGDQWTAHVEAYAPVWEALRRGWLETPWDPDAREGPSARARAVLDSRETLRRRLRRDLRDDRLADVAAHPFVLDGHDPRDVPAWAGVAAWVEQRFGGWAVVGGTGVLVAALTARLATRGVAVHTRTDALDVVLRGGRAVAVATSAGTLDADVVVCAVDPRRLPALAALARRTTPALPPRTLQVDLTPDHGLPLPEHELVLHGDPVLVLRPAAADRVTVLTRGSGAADPLQDLAGRGLDLRPHVRERRDRSPRDLVEEWGGTPLGVRWEGRSTVRRRPGPRTPVPGVYVAGAHATPGSGVPWVGLSAALVATAVLEDLGEPPG